MAADKLGRSEHVVLGVLAKRSRGAHGTALMDELEQLTGREWSVGALYTTLERLQRKGFVSSEWGEATAQRGGRRKRVFQVQAAGLRAMQEAQQINDRLAAIGQSRPLEA